MCAIIAIHNAADFASRWCEYGAACGHEIRKVNGYESGILARLRGCQAFLWHLNHEQTLDLLFARSVLKAAETQGIHVFPNHPTSWHFDDKIAQKYLLEAVNAPLVPTWVFYSQKDAIDFLKNATYPLVFKLRRGAGSLNVRLVRDLSEGKALARRMFGRGISPFPALGLLQQAAGKARRNRTHHDPFRVRLGRVMRRILEKTFHNPIERGYMLIQRLIPDNDHDLRVTIIGERAFAFNRGVRPNDFRASGSGRITYLSKSELPEDAIEIAFNLSRQLGFQSMAFDFARDSGCGAPLLLEMCYAFQARAIFDCPGYLDISGAWHSGHYHPEDLILDDLLCPRQASF